MQNKNKMRSRLHTGKDRVKRGKLCSSCTSQHLTKCCAIKVPLEKVDRYAARDIDGWGGGVRDIKKMKSAPWPWLRPR